jgi:hypothetical protein
MLLGVGGYLGLYGLILTNLHKYSSEKQALVLVSLKSSDGLIRGLSQPNKNTTRTLYRAVYSALAIPRK